MKAKSIFIGTILASLGLAAVVSEAMFPLPARAQEADPSAPTEADLLAAYEAHLDQNAAVASTFAGSGSYQAPTDGLTPDERRIQSNHGCPAGTVFWQRDRVTALCATVCATDNDCAADGSGLASRCRVWDVHQAPQTPVLLVEELPPAAVAELLDGVAVTVADATGAAVDVPGREPVPFEEAPSLVCDPFFDVAGAADADLDDRVIDIVDF